MFRKAQLMTALAVALGQTGFKLKGKPVTSTRKVRDPSQPEQAYAITRAEAKRARRAEKLKRDTVRSFVPE